MPTATAEPAAAARPGPADNPTTTVETAVEAQTAGSSHLQLDTEGIRGIAATVRALSAAGSGQRKIITECADQIIPRKLRWLWPERVPLGKITVFAGLPGQGKSLVTVDIAARLTTASKYFDSENPLPASEVLFVAGEDDPEDALVPRLMAAGADCSRIHRTIAVCVNERYDSLRLDMDAPRIEKLLKAHPHIRLVVIDPISNHLGSASMVDEQEVRTVLVPLAEIAKACDLAIICVLHINKKEGLAPIHRVSGAGAFIGVARASWLFAPDPQTQSHLMMALKNNYARDCSSLVYRVDERAVKIENDDVAVPCIQWLDETDADAEEVLSAPRKPRSEVAETFLQTFLAKGPQEASTVYEAAKKEGVSRRTLERSKQNLGVESQKKGDGWEWSLGGNR